MDDINSNINITCDMLVHIIKNLIVLSNTSTNVSSDAIRSLLSDLSFDQQSTASSSNQPPSTTSSSGTVKSGNTTHSGFRSILDETDFHLYHPLYLNNQLNHYKSGTSTPSAPDHQPYQQQQQQQPNPRPSTDNINHSK
jgi:hypothetical protein